MKADETRDVLIDSLISLLGKRAIAATSVRDIAARAGVNHGLVHRHFGSKDALLREAVIRTSAEVHRGHEEGLSSGPFAVLRKRPELARIVARVCLDGPHDLLGHAAPPEERIAEAAAAADRALTAIGVTDVDPHVVNALMTAAILGWFVFRPLLKRCYGIPGDADAQVASLLERMDRALG